MPECVICKTPLAYLNSRDTWRCPSCGLLFWKPEWREFAEIERLKRVAEMPVRNLIDRYEVDGAKKRLADLGIGP